MHSLVLRRLFVSDESGFFAVGLLLYEIYAGRRDITVMVLSALAVICALDQGVQNLDWMRGHFPVAFDNRVVLAVCLAAIAAVAMAVCVRRVPLPSAVVVAVGGLTYPLYLLHQHIGYMILNRFQGLGSPEWLVAATIAAMMAFAWMVWRFVERAGQRMTKRVLTRLVDRMPSPGRLTIPAVLVARSMKKLP
jgi:peptidoglycan/LPS O-acetylase OafA/YrhL